MLILFLSVILALPYLAQGAKCENCLECVNDQCKKCQPGFAFSPSKQCTQTSNFNSGQCADCQNLYTLTNGKCEKNDSEFCIRNSNQKCSDCLYGTYLQDGQCIGILNCAQYSQFHKWKCTKCSRNHYLYENTCYAFGTCQFTNQKGVCMKCSDNYELVGYRCVHSSNLVQKCKSYTPSEKCVRCQKGFIFNSQMNICQQESILEHCLLEHPLKNEKCMVCQIGYFGEDCEEVSKRCQRGKYNIISGQCFQCKLGFLLNETTGSCYDPNCIKSQGEECLFCEKNYLRQTSGFCLFYDPHCTLLGFSECFECQEGYFLNDQKMCRKKIQNCVQISPQGICQKCEDLYVLNDNQCIKLPDPNCRIFGKNGDCFLCSNRFYFSREEGKCKIVNPLCKTFNKNGQCTSCYPSFQVKGAKCALKIVEDKNCKTLGINGCLQCFFGHYVKQGKCQKVNILCKTHNQKGHCLSCYPGYILEASKCIPRLIDPFCRLLAVDGRCLACIPSYYFSEASKKCQRVSPLCQDYNKNNGECFSCFDGYVVSEGSCQLSSISLPNCKTISNLECVECYERFYVKNGKCARVPSLCDDYNISTGACTSCYPGYQLQSNICIIARDRQDRNCKVKNEKNDCLQCFEGFIVKEGKCQARIDQCSNYSQEFSRCFDCFPGYILNQNYSCVSTFSLISRDKNCLQFNNEKCEKCSDGYFINSEFKCQILDPLCKTHEKQGKCTSCYKGYILSGGKCINPVKERVQIPNCKNYNHNNNCSECNQRFYLKNNQCFFVSNLCGDYDLKTGNCLTCRSELHSLIKGECIPLNIVKNCVRYEGAFCAECESPYKINHQRICVLEGCQIERNGECLKCLEGKSLRDGKCE